MAVETFNPQVVTGGGVTLLTADPILIAVVRRCDELARQLRQAEERLRELRHQEVARFRTLRRRVEHIERRVCPDDKLEEGQTP